MNTENLIISLLIPSIESRKDCLKELKSELIRQFNNAGLLINKDYEIVVNIDDLKTIGEKRNYLLNAAKGKYIWFIDDDDMPSENAIELILEGIKHNPDVIELNGIITCDGINPERFNHSIKYKSYDKINGIYVRPPNHINPMKRELACAHSFPEKNFGEDTDWAMLHVASGTFKTEFGLKEIIYHYNYKTKK